MSESRNQLRPSRTNSPQRQRKTKDPCPRCRLHRDLCLCSLIQQQDLKTRITLLIHHREMKRTTNTGLLAIEALANSRLVIRGLQNQTNPLSEVLDENYETLLLFPSEEAKSLSEILTLRSQTKPNCELRPIHLLVPDGNWRQASKVHSRHPELATVQRVKISPQKTATDFLRKETVPDGMATLEAIAEALRLIEGEEVGAILKTLFQEKLERTLKGRGQKSPSG